MEIQEALKHHRGEGRVRLNCAESVAAAFGASPEPFASCGGGHAPDGWCGAAHAAAELLGDPRGVQSAFEAAAGAIRCREVRKAGLLTCAGCVELAARLVKDGRS